MTAVAAYNDEVAITVLAGIRRAGLRCPDDLAVIGMDEMAINGSMEPPLSSIEFDIDKLALLYADELSAILDGTTAPRRTPVTTTTCASWNASPHRNTNRDGPIMPAETTRALVLGGGGLTGIASETGILLGKAVGIRRGCHARWEAGPQGLRRKSPWAGCPRSLPKYRRPDVRILGDRTYGGSVPALRDGGKVWARAPRAPLRRLRRSFSTRLDPARSASHRAPKHDRCREKTPDHSRAHI